MQETCNVAVSHRAPSARGRHRACGPEASRSHQGRCVQISPLSHRAPSAKGKDRSFHFLNTSTCAQHLVREGTQHRESNPHSEVDMTPSMSCSACGSYLRPNLAAGNLRLWKTRRHSKSTIVPRICVPPWAGGTLGRRPHHSQPC